MCSWRGSTQSNEPGLGHWGGGVGYKESAMNQFFFNNFTSFLLCMGITLENDDGERPRFAKKEYNFYKLLNDRKATWTGTQWSTRVWPLSCLDMARQREHKTQRGDRGWDGWMASPTQWTWVWASSGRWWRTGKPGVLRSVGSQSQTWLSDWITRTVATWKDTL